jgi:hypothetical protein
MIFRVCRDPRAAGGDDRVRPAPIQPERASGAKQNRAKPNKTKQNCFDLLLLFTFIFSKRAISMSYRRFKQKISACFCMPAPVVNTAALLGHGFVGRSLGALRGSSL